MTAKLKNIIGQLNDLVKTKVDKSMSDDDFIAKIDAINLLCNLHDDLFVYLGSRKQKRIKEEWTNTYAVDDFTALDTPALLEYIGFILTAIRNRLYPCENYDGQYIQLWSEYASRPDVNRFAREASAMDLEIRQAMLVE